MGDPSLRQRWRGGRILRLKGLSRGNDLLLRTLPILFRMGFIGKRRVRIVGKCRVTWVL
jgi:hypothetical protein